MKSGSTWKVRKELGYASMYLADKRVLVQHP
jgi:hypothetical protein